MTRVVLAFFDCFAWLLRALGVDYSQFRAILHTKLTLDGRRQMSGIQQSQAKGSNYAFTWTLAFYAFMGIFVGAMLPLATSPLVGMTIVHAFVMTMVSVSLIADFTSVLLDTTDQAILQPRPVTSRTILVTRIAHISTYLALLTLSLSLLTFFIGTFVYSYLFPVVFLGTLLCSGCLIVFGVQLFYLIAMRLTNSERFRDLILYFQIAMTVLVFAGYQLLPRLVDVTQLKTLKIDDKWWIYIFPPTWLAAPIDILEGHIGTPQIILSALGVGVPAIGLFLVVRVLAPGFSRSLVRLEAATSGKTTRIAPAGHRRPFHQVAAKLISRRPAQRAAFELIWQLCAHDRQYKQRTYPTFAFLFVFAAVWIAVGERDIGAALQTLPESKKYFLVLYFSCMMAPMAILQLRFSSAPEAAWLYRALPIDRPGEILLAGFKVVIVRFVAPIFTLMAIGTLCIWGMKVWLDVLFALCAAFLVSALQTFVFGRKIPFSEEFRASQNTGRAGMSMLLMLFPATLGGIHYLLHLTSPMSLPFAAIVVLVLSILLLHQYARTDWATIQHPSL